MAKKKSSQGQPGGGNISGTTQQAIRPAEKQQGDKDNHSSWSSASYIVQFWQQLREQDKPQQGDTE